MANIPYEGDTSWVESTILEAIDCLKSDKLPAPGLDCDFCKYRNVVRQAVKQLENKLRRGIVWRKS